MRILASRVLFAGALMLLGGWVATSNLPLIWKLGIGFAEVGALIILLGNRDAPEPKTTLLPVAAAKPLSTPSFEAIQRDALLTTRENFRKLKDHCSLVEAKLRREHVDAALLRCAFVKKGDLNALAEELRSLTRTSSAAIYVWDKRAGIMALAGGTGLQSHPSSAEVHPLASASALATKAEAAVGAHNASSASLILKDASGPLAMIYLFASDKSVVDEARRTLAECSQLLRDIVRTIAPPKLHRERATNNLLTCPEFQGVVTGSPGGVIVILEALLEEGSEASFDAFCLRLLNAMPPGAAACRRRSFDLLAFLPNATLDEASAWASSRVAEASMIAVPSKGKMAPMGVRTKVAEVRRQSDRVFASK